MEGNGNTQPQPQAAAAVASPAPGKKTILLRRKLQPSQAPPPGALTADGVRARAAHAAAVAAQAAKLSEETRRQAEEEARSEQQQRSQEQADQHQSHSPSTQSSSPNKKALLIRLVPPSLSTSYAPASPSILPASLALKDAVGSTVNDNVNVVPVVDPSTLKPWQVAGDVGAFQRKQRQLWERQQWQQQQQLLQQQQLEHAAMQSMAEQSAEDEELTASPAGSFEQKEPPFRSRGSRLVSSLSQDLSRARALDGALAAARPRLAETGPAFESVLLDSAESRVLAAHRQVQAEWASFKLRTATRLGVHPSSLNISKTDGYRLKMESATLVDKSIPEQERMGAGREEQWASGLRGIGHTFVPIGNMFTGLFTKITKKDETIPKVEIIRRTADPLSAAVDAAVDAEIKQSASTGASKGLRRMRLPELPPNFPTFSTSNFFPGKTWAHSEYLLKKKHVQRKKIEEMASNEILRQEQARIKESLQKKGKHVSSSSQASGASITLQPVPAMDVLRVRGRDLFEITQEEEEWIRQQQELQQLEQLDQTADNISATRSEQKQRKKKSNKKAAKAAAISEALQEWDRPVQGPSLVLSHSRLFFSMKSGPMLSPDDMGSAGGSNGSVASTGGHSILPGSDDRVSRIVTIRNNGSTAVTYTWRPMEGALTTAAKEQAKREAEDQTSSSTPSLGAPLLSESDPSSFFYASNPSGTLLPGESVECCFTFTPYARIEGSNSTNGDMKTGAFIQRLSLVTEPKLPSNRPLTQWHAVQMLTAERATEDDIGDGAVASSSSEALPALVLKGVNTSLDTGSVLRANLYASLVASKNKSLTETHAINNLIERVPDPPPHPKTHRALFHARNTGDAEFNLPKLYYYKQLMPEWHTLARHVFDAQKRTLRESLVWDFSARMIAHWIHGIPQRNKHLQADLQNRFEELVAKSKIRPQPDPTRYELCRGLLVDLVASIPRLSHEFETKLGMTEPLEADVRKAREEEARKAEEEARAKLPFHLRQSAASTAAAADRALTAEQRAAKEEERVRAEEAAARQAAEDESKRAERAQLQKVASDALHAHVRAALLDACSYFDFLAAPPHTDEPPQALNPDTAAREAFQRMREESTQHGGASMDVGVLVRQAAAAAANAADPSAATSSPGKPSRPRSARGKDSSALSVPGSQASSAHHRRRSSAQHDKDKDKEKEKDKEKDSPSSSTPATPRSTDPNEKLLSQFLPPPPSSDDSLLAAAVANPALLDPFELEHLRGRSLVSFLAAIRSRRVCSSRLLRQHVVFFGNGYSTPDCGVHVPTPTEVGQAAERERRARYGQQVSKAELEAEEKKIRDMHPMSPLANRQIVAAASGSYFNVVATREGGVWAWIAHEPAEAVVEEGATADKKKGGTSGAGSKSSAPGRTKLQEARKALFTQQLQEPTAAASTPGKKDESNKGGSGASAKDRAGSSKASPRASQGGRSSSNKKNTSRPGSGQAARSASPTPGAANATLEQPLVPAIPRAELPLAALCTPAPGAAPQPVYIPELQGLDVACVTVGVHTAWFVTHAGALWAWESSLRKVHLIVPPKRPGQDAWEKHVWTSKAIEKAMEKERENGEQSTRTNAMSSNAEHSAQNSGRPPSRGSSPAAVRKTGAETNRLRSPAGSPGSTTSTASKNPGRRTGAAGAVTIASASSASSKSNRASKADEAEILAVDSASYEAEQERLARLARDADLIASGKQIVSVVVGGSSTLSSTVSYATNPAVDFEYLLILTSDGCVYSSVITPSPLPGAASDSGSSKGGSSKAAAKDGEKSTAMLGLGEKEKEKEKSKDKDTKQAAKESNDAAPLVHFELVATLHPANLNAATPLTATKSASSSDASLPPSSTTPADEIRVVSLSAGYGHAVALLSDGRVFVWGNDGPWLGLGGSGGDKKSSSSAAGSRSLPTHIAALSHITRPSLEEALSSATVSESSSSPSDTRPPTAASVASNSGVSQSSSNGRTSAGAPGPASSSRSSRGSVSGSVALPASGSKKDKEKEKEKEEKTQPTPEQDSSSQPLSSTPDPIVSIACGAFHSLALTESGAVFAFGRNTEAQLGLGDTKDRDVPTLVIHLSPSHNPLLLHQAIKDAKAPPPAPKAAAAPSGFSNRLSATGALNMRASSGSMASQSATNNTQPAEATSLSPFLKVTSITAGGAHSLFYAQPLPEATKENQDGSITQLARSAVFACGQSTLGATAQLPPQPVSDDPSATSTFTPSPSHLPTPIPFFDGKVVRTLTAGGDASQLIVQREKKAATGLVPDEDDLPEEKLVD